MKISPILAALALPLFAHAAATADAGIGTLFYSAEERAAIVQARNGDKSTAVASGIAVSGLVKRADGKGTVWANGRAVPEGTPIPPVAAPGIRPDGVVIDGAKVRVGETLNPRTGERTDLLAPGALSRGKTK